jgi:hypothetical protein
MKHWYVCKYCTKNPHPCVLYCPVIPHDQCIECGYEDNDADWQPATPEDMELVRKALSGKEDR